MEAKFLADLRSVVVVLGRPYDQIPVTTVTIERMKVEFGPGNQYRADAVVFPSNGFSSGTDCCLNVSNFHLFGSADWRFVHYNGETIQNDRFVCPQCKLLSGEVTGIEPGETGEGVHVIECQECNARLYPPIAQTA